MDADDQQCLEQYGQVGLEASYWLDHFCILACGRRVPTSLMLSMLTLYRFSNTSSSSMWYERDRLRKAKGLNKCGDLMSEVADMIAFDSGFKMWAVVDQLRQFGSGFKCSSTVWRVFDISSSDIIFSIKI
ncbi:hypothetical protein E2562_033558 [Oryza meyeriana var. granulata]|uniref:Uncharacterized protein n=1 Tax=Oryza meyeriana var. granulata TaxID=110450 RepID=A0A6G1ESD5_9ORYZ|nr:hypothetical protein E2562_033558 [Oryza meyeriana var. granulata]